MQVNVGTLKRLDLQRRSSKWFEFLSLPPFTSKATSAGRGPSPALREPLELCGSQEWPGTTHQLRGAWVSEVYLSPPQDVEPI